MSAKADSEERQLWHLYWADHKKHLRPVFSNGTQFSKDDQGGLWPVKPARPTNADYAAVRKEAERQLKEDCFWVVVLPNERPRKIVAPENWDFES